MSSQRCLSFDLFGARFQLQTVFQIVYCGHSRQHAQFMSIQLLLRCDACKFVCVERCQAFADMPLCTRYVAVQSAGGSTCAMFGFVVVSYSTSIQSDCCWRPVVTWLRVMTVSGRGTGDSRPSGDAFDRSWVCHGLLVGPTPQGSLLDPPCSAASRRKFAARSDAPGMRLTTIVSRTAVSRARSISSTDL